MMKSPIAAALLASMALMGTASADPILEFGTTGFAVTLDNGGLSSTTTSETIIVPGEVTVYSLSTPITDAEAGISLGDPVAFSNLTFNTTVGPNDFTMSVGDLVFTFTDVFEALEGIVAGAGFLDEGFTGTVTTDTSGFGFRGQSAVEVHPVLTGHGG